MELRPGRADRRWTCPRGHAAVGSLPYRLLPAAPTAGDGASDPPAGPAVLALGVGTPLTDLVDKPLPWSLALRPAGRALAHSAPVVAALVAATGRYGSGDADRRRAGGSSGVAGGGRGPSWPVAVAVALPGGHASHLLADVPPGVLAGEVAGAGHLPWPVVPAAVYAGEESWAARFPPEITAFLLVHPALALVAVAVAVRLRDGAPGLAALASVVGRRAGPGTGPVGRSAGRRLAGPASGDNTVAPRGCVSRPNARRPLDARRPTLPPVAPLAPRAAGRRRRPRRLHGTRRDAHAGRGDAVADAVAVGHEGYVAGGRPHRGTVRWRVTLPENPTADGTLVVLTHGLSRPNALVALDLATGERRWSHGEFPEAFGGPTVADGTVYAAVDGGVEAVAAAGERRWRTAVPDAGATHGPVTVAGDLAVVPDGGAVVAFDAATGERRWRAGESTLGRAGASLVAAAHGRLYAATGRGHREPYDVPTPHALDPATGERVGSYATAGAGEPGVAEVEDGLVVVDRLLDTPDRPAETPVTTPEATPAGTPPTAAERPPKPARACGVAPDLSGTEWRTELPASPWYGSPPAAAGAVACVGSRSGVATALDVRSGETPWTHGFDVPLDLRRPAVADGVCPFGSSAGLVALAPDRTDGGDRRRQL